MLVALMCTFLFAGAADALKTQAAAVLKARVGTDQGK